MLGVYTYRLHMSDKQTLPIALRLYEIAIRIETPLSCPNLEVYCNALWILQKDNTGLPINHERNLAFLQKCLPYAPRNPAIYYNAACLYVEMEDFDHALENIDLAMQNRNHYSEYDQMIHQLKTEPMFAAFRQDERVKQLLDRE